MPGAHLTPHSLLTLFSDMNIRGFEKSLSFPLSLCIKLSPVAEYKGFRKLLVYFFVLISLYTLSHAFIWLKVHGSVLLIFSDMPAFVWSSTLQNTSSCFPSPLNLYTSIRQNMKENVNNLPEVEIIRLVANITTFIASLLVVLHPYFVNSFKRKPAEALSVKGFLVCSRINRGCG